MAGSALLLCASRQPHVCAASWLLPCAVLAFLFSAFILMRRSRHEWLAGKAAHDSKAGATAAIPEVAAAKLWMVHGQWCGEINTHTYAPADLGSL